MEASWRRLGGVLEAMLSQDRSKKAQDAKTLKKPWKTTKVFGPPAEASWRHLGDVLEVLGGVLEVLGGNLEVRGGVLEALGGVLEASWRRLGGHDEPR